MLSFALSVRGGSLIHRIRRVVGCSSATIGPVRGVIVLALLFGLLLAFAGPSLTVFARLQAERSTRPRIVEASQCGRVAAHAASDAAVQAQGASETAGD